MYYKSCYTWYVPVLALISISGQETSSKEVGRKTSSEYLSPISVPSPVFQSSPLVHETEIQTVPNGVDLFQPLPSHQLEMSTQKSTASSPDASLDSSDFFKLAPQTLNPFDSTPKTSADGSAEVELPLSRHPVVTNPFHQAAATEAELFQHPPMKEELFSTSHLTNEDVFSPLSAHTPEPFPRTVTRDLLKDFSGSEEPSAKTPPSQYNPFTGVSNGTPEIFRPLPKDTPSGLFPASTLWSPSVRSDVEKPPSVFLATPQGSKHNILQATPFIQARSLSASSSQSSPEMSRVGIL